MRISHIKEVLSCIRALHQLLPFNAPQLCYKI